MTTLDRDAATVCDLIRDRMVAGQRLVVGIAGPPASGKSTLAEAVVERLNLGADAPVAALLPMDGYHLDNSVIEPLGLLPRKGAPETFDAEGYCAAVTRLAATLDGASFPSFDRALDRAIPDAIPIAEGTPVIVAEGNYLLLDSPPWSRLREVFGATVFVRPTLEALRERLYRRWTDHGLDPDAARRRAEGNDIPNAERVLRESGPADIELSQALSE